MEEIKAIHQKHHETYGSPRIAEVLRHRGYRCSRPRVARLMRVLGIRARTARKFKVTTDSNHHEPIAEDFLGQDFSVDIPNEVWSSDITYLRTDSGWHYLTVILDLFNREIIGLLAQQPIDGEQHRYGCPGHGVSASSAIAGSNSALGSGCTICKRSVQKTTAEVPDGTKREWQGKLL